MKAFSMLRGKVFFLLLFLQNNFSGKVVAVMDGDTIEVMHNGKAERVRLSGIDCPEKSQDFGNKAKEYTSSLVAGKQVFVKHNGRDRYDRVLGDVYVINGKDSLWVNLALIEAGYAWHYKMYSADQRLASAEINAKNKALGLWIDKAPVEPWEYRKMKN